MAAAKATVAPASTAARNGWYWLAPMFLVSLLFPITISMGTVQLTPNRMFVAAVLIPVIIAIFTGRFGRVLPADVLLFVATLWAGAAYVLSGGLGPSVQPFGVMMLEFFGSYAVARASLRSPRDFIRFIRFLFPVVAVLVVFAAIESITYRNLLLQWFPGASIRDFADFRLNLKRAQTLFPHSILFGVFCAACLGLFWYTLPKGLRIVGAVVSAAGTFFALSSGAMIAYTVQVGLISWEAILASVRNRWRVFIGLTIAGYVVIDLISNRTPFQVIASYLSFSTTSSYNRILIWVYGTQNVRDHPFFGLGFGLDDWERPVWMVASIDNYWLLLAMTYGLPMLLMTLTGLILLIRRVGAVPLTGEDAKACRRSYLVSVVGIIIAGGTVHYWHQMMAFTSFVFGCGAFLAARAGEWTRVEAEGDAQAVPEVQQSPYRRNRPVDGYRREPRS